MRERERERRREQRQCLRAVSYEYHDSAVSCVCEYEYVCVCESVCVCACVSACVRARACVCVRACMFLIIRLHMMSRDTSFDRQTDGQTDRERYRYAGEVS